MIWQLVQHILVLLYLELVLHKLTVPIYLQVYTKDGNVNSYPKLHRPSGTFWSITTNTPFPGAPLYYETAETISQCPPSGTAWSVGPFGSADAPTVIGITAGPDCSIPANRCAFAAGGESGRSRFRRLVALGYV